MKEIKTHTLEDLNRGQCQFTDYRLMCENLKLLKEQDVKQELLANGCITTSPDSLLSYQTHIQGDFPLIGETIFTI